VILIAFTRPFNLALLTEQLFAAFPAWTQTVGGNQVAMATVSGDGTTGLVYAPDGTDPAAVMGVVNAHDPNAPLPVPPQLQQQIADAVVILNNAAVMVDAATRDAMARTIHVKPLAIPFSQKAVLTDIRLQQ